MITKKCTKCNRIFPATTEYFHKSKDGKCGLKPRCKKCRIIDSENWNTANPEKKKVTNNKWKKDNPEKQKESNSKYERSSKGKISRRKVNAKRRGYDSIILFDNPFADNIPVIGHHLCDGFIVYLPRSLHLNHYGKNHRQELKPYVEGIYNITYMIEKNYININGKVGRIIKVSDIL